MTHIQQPLAAGYAYLTGGALNGSFSVGGTWTAYATLTLPAYTLGGTVTSNGQSFSGTIADLGTVTTADINGGTIDGATIGGASAAAGTFTTVAATTGNITTVNATTVDATNIEVTNLKAKDGTSAGSIADTTGVVTLGSSVLTTTDINGGTIDGVALGGTSAVSLGTPSSGTLTNCTGLPATGVTGTALVAADIGTSVQAYDADLTTWAGVTPAVGVATFLATPSSANLASAVTDETGSGALVFGTSPALTTPTINTAASVGGTWTAAATWTLPAFTLGGTVTSNGQSFSGTIANLGTVTTADINGGTIDGAVIGGGTKAAGSFTTLAATGLPTFSGAPDANGTYSLANAALRVGGTLATGGQEVRFFCDSTNDLTAIQAVETNVANADLALNINGGSVGVGANPTTKFHVAGGTSGAIHVNDTGQLYGTALHNNSGAVTGTTNQYIASGTYTPTLTGVTNIASSTPLACQYMRVGNVVTVSGVLSVTATAAAPTESQIDVSLPIASNLANANELGGSGASGTPTNEAVYIIGDTTNNRAILHYSATTTAGSALSFTFSYVVL